MRDGVHGPVAQRAFEHDGQTFGIGARACALHGVHVVMRCPIAVPPTMFAQLMTTGEFRVKVDACVAAMKLELGIKE